MMDTALWRWWIELCDGDEQNIVVIICIIHTSLRVAGERWRSETEKKKAASPIWIHRFSYLLITFFVSLLPVETQVPDCTEFLRNFLQRFQPQLFEDWNIANDNCYCYDSYCDNSHSFHKTISFLKLINNYRSKMFN